MNGAHDMGGRMGFGPVRMERNEPVFHATWEGRFFALANLLGEHAGWTLDTDRHACENRPPLEYLQNSYYETWLSALESLVTQTGVLERAADRSKTLSPAQVMSSLLARGSYRRSVSVEPQFVVGDIVRVRNLQTPGHTRLPAYLRGQTGKIVAHFGAHVFPDSNAHGLGENPQHLFSVRFKAAEVFSTSGPDTLHADMWESYLEAV